MKYIRQKTIYISASFDNTVKIWLADTFECCKTIPHIAPNEITISKDGRLFCVSSHQSDKKKCLFIYNAVSYDLVNQIPILEENIYNFTFSDDNLKIYIITSRWIENIGNDIFSVKCWNINDKKYISSFDYPLCYDLQYCYNSKKLITTENGTTKIWNIENNECIYSQKTSIRNFYNATEKS